MTKAAFKQIMAICQFLILLFLLFASRYVFLSGQAFLNGPDAYYYALQIKFFIADGVLKISDSSPLLQLMGFTAKLGFSPEQTIILWTILIQLLCGISVFAAYRLMHGQEVSGIIPGLLVVWTVVSPTLTFTCIEFPKYAFALIFLPLWPVVLANKHWWPVSAGAVILSCISHLTMIGILMVLLAGLAVFWGFPPLFGAKACSKRIRFQWLMVIGAVLLLTVAGIIGGKYFLLADLKRIQLQGLQPALWTFASRGELPFWLKAEVLGAAIVCIILSVKAFRDKGWVNVRLSVLLWLPFVAFLLIVPLSSKEIMGIPERLCLALPLTSVALLACLRLNFGRSLRIFFVTLALLILTFIIAFPKGYFHAAHPNRLNPDYALYDRVTAAVSGRDIPMLIAHQGLNYYYKYKTMKESFPYEPESHWPKLKIWRIVFGITPSTWAYYLPEQDLWGGDRLIKLPGTYSLIREDLWVQFRERVRTSQDEELRTLVFYSWFNPSQKRPEFARKRAEKDTDSEFSAFPIQNK